MIRWRSARRLFVPALLVAAVLNPPPAAAAPPGPARESAEVVSARQHFKAGEKAFNAGEYAKALAEFEAGYLLVPRAGFLLNMAHTERRLGHAGRARELYQRYLDTDPQSAQRTEVRALIAELDRTLNASARGESPPAPPTAVNDPTPTAVTNPMTPVPEAPAGAAAVAPAGVEPVPATAAPETAAAVPLPPAPVPAEPSPDLVSTTASHEAPTGPPAQRPVYKQWWFWAAVGVVAVAATTTAILATRPPTAAFQDDGSLGRVGGP